ncbi:KdsC family phosphatase [Croceimicrobium sp.]|uniref:KdsC family phosphatase n=1 Tax=Croceimicrobium sp. TaxID=2828340 RepID=UPI003BAB5CC1
MKKNYKELLHPIKAFIFDMDGVLNSGNLAIGQDGKPIRNLNSKDSYAIQLAVRKGYKVGLISGGSCAGIKTRLQGLGLTDIYMSIPHKLEAWNDFLAVYEHEGLQPENILYMGDDIPDIPVLKEAGVACCPQNGVPEVRQLVDYVSPHLGGDGCARDVIEQCLKVQDNWMLEDDFRW